MDITIHVAGKEISMPGATLAKYATARVAEALGHDVEDGRYAFSLEEPGVGPIDPDHVMADHDGKRLRLYGARR